MTRTHQAYCGAELFSDTEHHDPVGDGGELIPLMIQEMGIRTQCLEQLVVWTVQGKLGHPGDQFSVCLFLTASMRSPQKDDACCVTAYCA